MNGLPPSTVGYNNPTSVQLPNASFFVLLLPYMEQTSAYDLVKTKTNNFTITMNNANFWNVLGASAAETTSLQSSLSGGLSGFKCPSRRGGKELLANGTDNTNNEGGLYGPQGDYAFVQGRIYQHWSSWVNNYNPIKTATADTDWHAQGQVGAIRVAIWSNGTNASSWQPRDSMSWWSDGTSNQIVVGEKHIRKDFVGQCTDASSNPNRWKVGDCTILVSGAFNTMSVARSCNSRFARGPNDGSGTSNFGAETEPHWGSAHSGIVNFLIGDGSVRSISVTTPDGPLYTSKANADAKTNLSNSILGRLGVVNDGNSVSLP
jgi:hypothetical protein